VNVPEIDFASAARVLMNIYNIS